KAAIILQVGLNNVDSPVTDHPVEPPCAVFLFSTGHRDRKRIRDLFGFLQMIKRAGLFEVNGVDLFEETTDANGMFGIIRTVRICMDIDLVSQVPTCQWNQILSATW